LACFAGRFDMALNEWSAAANITSITLDDPGKAAFTLGDVYSITTLAEWGTAKFTLQPKTGLLATWAKQP